jgi:hypothetical protein
VAHQTGERELVHAAFGTARAEGVTPAVKLEGLQSSIADCFLVCSTDRGRMALDFGRTHPSHMFRIKQQGTLLEKLGWWKEIKNGKSHYITLIDNAMQLKDDVFSTAEFDFGNYILKAFLSMVEELHSKVEEPRSSTWN